MAKKIPKRLHSVRTSITVPPDVKRRMDALEKIERVNWSALFARAVEKYLKERGQE